MLLSSAALLAACGGGGDGGAPGASVSVSAKNVIVTSNTLGKGSGASVIVTKHGVNPYAVTLSFEHGSLITGVSEYQGDTSYKSRLDIGLGASQDRPVGTYSDILKIHACLGFDCSREIEGSPLIVAITLTVTDPDPAVTSASLANVHGLAHDVIDAEYSDALERIVMVSSQPAPALYLYDPQSGLEQAVSLTLAPAAVSVGPDGLSAAVAHDHKATLVDLTLASPPVVYDVGYSLVDIALAGNGYAYATAAYDGEIKSINLSSKAVASGGAGGLLRLDPTANALFSVSPYSPSDIRRNDITGGNAVFLKDSPYHGEFAICGGIWLEEGGAGIFNGCGTSLRRAADADRDLRYGGAMALAPAQDFWPVVQSLSHSAEANEILLLEEGVDECYFDSNPCHTHLAAFEDGRLNLKRRYALPGIEVDGVMHLQRGRFVFHSSDGARRFLVGQAWGAASAARGWQVSEPVIEPALATSPPRPAEVTMDRADPGIPLAPLTDLRATPHDIVDAEYSASLDAIVMASTYPSNALWVQDMATRAERSIALAKPPTSVSIAPDGTHAAVGHDALVSVVDLARSGAAATVLLDVTTNVHDIVMGGQGYVYAFSGWDTSSPLYSIQVATNTEVRSANRVYGITRAYLHPSGSRMYGAGMYSYPSMMQRFALGSGAATPQSDARIEDEVSCGELWIGETGADLFTACGRTFSSSEVQADDMAYRGTFPMTDGGHVIAANDSAEVHELAILERSCDYGTGRFPYPCRTLVARYDDLSLELQSRFTLPERTRGLFVFHSANGSQLYVVSRKEAATQPLAEFYVGVLND